MAEKTCSPARKCWYKVQFNDLLAEETGLDQVEAPKRRAIVPRAPDTSADTQTHSHNHPAQTAPDDKNTDKDQEESEEESTHDEIIELTDPLGENEQTYAANPSTDTLEQGSDLQIK